MEVYALFSNYVLGKFQGVSASLEVAKEHALAHTQDPANPYETRKTEGLRLVNWTLLDRQKEGEENWRYIQGIMGWLGDEEVWSSYSIDESGQRHTSYWIKKIQVRDVERSVAGAEVST